MFVAHMSGNTVSVTTHVALGEAAEVARRVFAIVAFVVGLAIGTTATMVARRRAPRTGFSIALFIEAALLSLVLFGGEVASHGARVVPRQPAMVYYALVGASAAAMGIQGVTLRRVRGASVSTTYITGVLTRFVEGLVHLVALGLSRRHIPPALADDGEWRRTADRVRLLGGVWLAYAAGGISSGVIAVRFGFRALALPLSVLIAAVVLDGRLARTGTPGSGAEDD
jgi:uncharacterized membrane protein YoaK (UPF0700 family)